MPKRIFVLCCIVFILVSMVVPAFAITGNNPSEFGVTTAGIYFDSIYFNAVQPTSAPADVQPFAVASWPFNETGRNLGAEVEMTLPENGRTLFLANVLPASNYVSGSFSLMYSGYFELSARQMYFSDRSTLTIGGSGDDAPSGFSKVIVSYDVLTLELGSAGLQYIPTYESVYYDSSSDGFVLTSELDIGDLITRAYAVSTGEEFYGDPAMLSNVSVKVYFSDSSLGHGAVFTVYSTHQNEGSFFGWGEEQDLLTNTDRTWYDWLLSSISSFLNLEIAPGLSFNKLFWVVLVIVVLLAFAKLIR